MGQALPRGASAPLQAAKIADALTREVHYTVDEKQKSVLLTEDGWVEALAAHLLATSLTLPLHSRFHFLRASLAGWLGVWWTARRQCPLKNLAPDPFHTCAQAAAAPCA